MDHNFQITSVHRPITNDTEYLMYCNKCGLTYRYTGYRWEVIPFKPMERPQACNDDLKDFENARSMTDDEKIERLGGTIPEE